MFYLSIKRIIKEKNEKDKAHNVHSPTHISEYILLVKNPIFNNISLVLSILRYYDRPNHR